MKPQGNWQGTVKRNSHTWETGMNDCPGAIVTEELDIGHVCESVSCQKHRHVLTHPSGTNVLSYPWDKPSKLAFVLPIVSKPQGHFQKHEVRSFIFPSQSPLGSSLLALPTLQSIPHLRRVLLSECKLDHLSLSGLQTCNKDKCYGMSVLHPNFLM